MEMPGGCIHWNTEIPEPGSTPSWGTELGQKIPEHFMYKDGCSELLNGILYNRVALGGFKYGDFKDSARVGDDDGGSIIEVGVFPNTALKILDVSQDIDGCKITVHTELPKFILALIKEVETAAIHFNRRTLKMNPKYTCTGESNNAFYNKCNEIIGIGNPWFGLELNYDKNTNLLTLTVVKAPVETYRNNEERRNKREIYVKRALGQPLHPLNQILYGPPGAGKTYNAVNHALSIALKKDLKSLIDSQKRSDRQRESDKKDFDILLKDGQIRFVTFHQSYSYEDFVQGIKPRVVKNNIQYRVKLGVFKQICRDASRNPEKNYVLIIDEINRGNISKIFGELITLIEDSKRIGNPEALEIKLVYSKIKFGVPKNVYIIGTMNTADKSIALVDLALRRRFTFSEYPADPTLLETTEDGIDLEQMLTIINKRIEFLLDKDHSIGHSYLMGKKDMDEVLEVFKNKIIPLLCEYFHNDFKKICWVLGDHEKWKKNDNEFLVRKKVVTLDDIFGRPIEDEFGGKENEMYELNKAFKKLTKKSVLGIYLKENEVEKIIEAEGIAAAAAAALPPASGGTGPAPTSSLSTP